MVSEPRPGVLYTPAEFEAMRRAYPDFVMPGYVIRLEEGYFSFVPWNQATGGGQGGTRPARGYQMKWSEEDYPFHRAPTRKRTPQQRLDSLADRIAEDTKAGRVLTAEELQRVTVNAWKRGEPVSGEAVRAVAAMALSKAEERAKPEDRGRVPNVTP